MTETVFIKREIEYLIVGANGWSCSPDFQRAYKKWRLYASGWALKRPKEVEVIIYQVDTPELAFEEGCTPVWVDEMGLSTHWTWKDIPNLTKENPLTEIYKGYLSKAPRSNKALDKFLFLTFGLPQIVKDFHPSLPLASEA